MEGTKTMVRRNSEMKTVELWNGIRRKTTNFGDKTLMVEIEFDAGSIVENHSHPHEQIGYLVSGRMNLTIGRSTWEVQKGDSWIIPGNVPHSAEILEPSLAIEVFSPVREEYK